jgi:hypothetical protein
MRDEVSTLRTLLVLAVSSAFLLFHPMSTYPLSGNPQISQSDPVPSLTNVQCGHTLGPLSPPPPPAPPAGESRPIPLNA